jgi:hypothetical protein
LPGRRIKRLEIGELFRVGYRSVSPERRRLRDRLSDDRNAQNLFKGFLGRCNDWRIDPLLHRNIREAEEGNYKDSLYLSVINRGMKTSPITV